MGATEARKGWRAERCHLDRLRGGVGGWYGQAPLPPAQHRHRGLPGPACCLGGRMQGCMPGACRPGRRVELASGDRRRRAAESGGPRRRPRPALLMALLSDTAAASRIQFAFRVRRLPHEQRDSVLQQLRKAQSVRTLWGPGPGLGLGAVESASLLVYSPTVQRAVEDHVSALGRRGGSHGVDGGDLVGASGGDRSLTPGAGAAGHRLRSVVWAASGLHHHARRAAAGACRGASSDEHGMPYNRGTVLADIDRFFAERWALGSGEPRRLLTAAAAAAAPPPAVEFIFVEETATVSTLLALLVPPPPQYHHHQQQQQQQQQQQLIADS
jgi:hypothetical protein